MNLKPLIDLLSQEQKVHEQLLIAKREERKWLAVGDAPQLLKNTERISDLVDRAKACEKKRMELTRQIAEELGISATPLTLKEILAALPPANKVELERAGQSLKNTLETVRNTNRSNYQVLQKSVSTIQEELKQFNVNHDSGVYTARGTKGKFPTPRAGLNIRA